jgi:transposase
MNHVQRYIGIDLSKQSMQITIISEGIKKIEQFKHSTNYDGLLSLSKRLFKEDIVGLETGNFSFMLTYFLQKTVGCQVNVLNAGKLHIIFASHKKTDKNDSMNIAKFLQRTPAEELPVVQLPSEKEMLMRKKVVEHEQLNKQRTRSINILHNLFWDAGITHLTKNDMKDSKNRQKHITLLPQALQKHATRQLEQLELCESQINDIEAEEVDMLKDYLDTSTINMSMPGVGPQVCVALLAYLGNMERFANARQVGYYLGFTPRVDQSGQQNKYGRITKTGPKLLRKVLNQAAWSAIRSSQGGSLKTFFHRLSSHCGKKRAIVAVGRKMVTILYALHKNGELYKHSDGMEVERTIKKMQKYSIIPKESEKKK